MSIRACLGFLLLGSVSRPVCQTESPIDSAVYLSFFREVAGHVILPDSALKNEPAFLIGHPSDLVTQSIQEAIAITDREAKTVIDAAAGCEGEIGALETHIREGVHSAWVRKPRVHHGTQRAVAGLASTAFAFSCLAFSDLIHPGCRSCIRRVRIADAAPVHAGGAE
jgi:hypothetical protein